MSEINADERMDAAEESKPPRKRAVRRTKKTAEAAPESAAAPSSPPEPSIIFEDGDRSSNSSKSTEKSSAAPPVSHESISESREESGGPTYSEGSEGGGQPEGGGSQEGGYQQRERGDFANRRGRRRGRRRRGNVPGGGTPNQQQQPQRGQGYGGNNGNWNQRGGGGGNRRQQQQPQRRAPVNPSSEEIVGAYEGVLEMHPKGYGFLRDATRDYSAQESDPFVSSTLIERYKLREGVKLVGEVGPGTRGQGPRLKSISSVEGGDPEEYHKFKHFDELTPVNPYEHIKLETGPYPITTRVIDLLTPIGKGQRALIVAPPRTGKTMLLQDIADAVAINHPELHVIVLLIDERPEEVTEMRRKVKGEVVASSMDREVESHIRISQLIFERAKRLTEAGGEVFVLLDSITRTARAFNKWVGNSGRTQTGGLDIRALDIPKKMFGTARRFEEGGSLTVIGTALIDTGSRADESIFQEFKGTGNMELVLSRDLADRRIWPAIDITLSGTRREEKILAPQVLEGTTMLRRSLVSLSPVEAMEQLTKILQKYPTNEEFLSKVRAIL